MDSVTHALAGVVIGYAGFRQHPRGGRIALWTAIVAAEFPDADILLRVASPEAYWRWHRTFTHSALLWPLWALLVAETFWLFFRRADFRILFYAALAGIASHLLLDWITSYGTLLLWPLTDARFELGWVFILDPYVWGLLSLAVWAVFRSGQHASVARIGLVIVAGYILFCGASHAWALSRVDGGHVRAYAVPLKPLNWIIVRAEGEQIHWINGTQNDTFTQYQDSLLVPQAEATDAVKFFRWFAEFPLVERLEEKDVTILRYRDLRFRSVLPSGEVREGLFLTAQVTFDKNGHLRQATLGRDAE